MNRALQMASSIVLLLAITGIFVSPVHAKPSNKWRIEVSGGAKSDGEIVFLVNPINADKIEVRVSVKNRTRENNVAKTIRDALKAQLPSSGYHIEVDDGEDVLVKKKRGSADFDLLLIGNSVKRVRINLDRE